jgi:hypothetical protein
MTYRIIRLTEDKNPTNLIDYYQGTGDEVFGGISPTPYFGARWRAPKFNSVDKAKEEIKEIQRAMQEGTTPQRELQVIDTRRTQTK